MALPPAGAGASSNWMYAIRSSGMHASCSQVLSPRKKCHESISTPARPALASARTAAQLASASCSARPRAANPAPLAAAMRSAAGSARRVSGVSASSMVISATQAHRLRTAAENRRWGVMLDPNDALRRRESVNRASGPGRRRIAQGSVIPASPRTCTRAAVRDDLEELLTRLREEATWPLRQTQPREQIHRAARGPRSTCALSTTWDSRLLGERSARSPSRAPT